MSDGLYGIKQASKTKAKEISSSTSVAFSTSLASLISSSSSVKSKPGAARSRPSKDKSDIFTAHNKNVKKRSTADLEDASQRHKTKDDIGSVDAAELHRSKKKMEDKVRIYNAMKRGEYIGRDDGPLVDFDRKWAEGQAGGRADESDHSEDEDSGSEGEEVEYLDEFGRLRKGTKAQAEREERRKRVQTNALEEEERMSARPSMPTNVIYGDTVQAAAFNPDQVIADRMAEISKKRDKSATPPPDTHYDANAEVRNKGTGFYTFSKDADERKKEMDALDKERQETERARKEREEKKEQRKKEIEERRKLISEQKAKAQAEKFLDNLDIDGI
ncbi:hypothetical protein LTR10_020094 [Elasticomyces elasticus]|uniref:Nuclear speckle splicing regulatory protein 1 N-terminal domain-containing protein n=1 Tax=Exophiala sideris TaxID=1016849 RepID=A0ABR0IVV0_9EURO|nr:hypothetical protein LTR10_020094 [Elasticomyces elasticus]KAK5021324.1 hypothetical protein LTS07_011067 [Exophiala sideris]KAK5024272.1 hypothetical protein LTR13_010893 [Exophiala sideris]KAK5049215.1 hypothetical protein LTR69_011090 [Exophiala sideris]KAK5176527.1 hypothetical protein LTR44_010915 [Eurotiomycetes sp. CCFEE 6388]